MSGATSLAAGSSKTGLRIRQIVLVARDLEATVADCEAVLGVRVVYRDPQVAEFGLANALMRIGDQFLEVVSPIKADTAAGRHLERRGDSAYMLIFQTDDLDRDRARLERLGVRIVWQANYPDVRAVHLHPKDIGAAIVSLDQPQPPASWRWAGPAWEKDTSPTNARRILSATIETRDPTAMSRRWAELLAIGSGRDVARLSLKDGTLDFVPGPVDGIVAYGIAMNRPQEALNAARSRGLRAAESIVTLCGTRFHLLEEA